MDISSIVAIVLALLFIGLLSGMEIAFISSNKLSLELSKKKRSSAKFWSNIANNPTNFMGSLLIVTTTLVVFYGLFIGNALDPFWALIEKNLPQLSTDNLYFIRLFFETILATFMLLVVKFLSKAFFTARSNNALNNTIITLISQAIHSVFSLFSSIIISFCDWLLKNLFNVRLNKSNQVFSKDELEHLVVQNTSSFNKKTEDHQPINKELFENALGLGAIKVRECLTPRKEIIGLPSTATVEEAKQKFISTRLSKLLVYDKNLDNILGYIHHLDMFKQPSQIMDVLLPIPMIPESMPANDLMDKFAKEKKSIAWVIDEFGGTSGIVTMEDLQEELFGDIKDEYDDVDEFIDKQISNNEYIFSGRIEMDAIAEKYQLDFGDYEGTQTLSGYIIDQNGSIPKEKERIIIGLNEFNILSVSETRIEMVKLKVLQ